MRESESTLSWCQRRTSRKHLALAWVLLCAVLATLCFSFSASAQNIELNSGSGFTILREEERASGEYPWWINRQDCLEDDADFNGERTTLRFSPSVTGYTNRMSLEIYAATGANECTENEDRQGTAAVCALVGKIANLTVGNPNIYVKPRSVLEGLLALQDANASKDVTDPDDTFTEEVCEANQESDVVFHLLLIEDGNIVGTPAKWTETRVDTAAPPAPTFNSENEDDIVGGDGLIFLQWTVETADERDDTQGFRFYCEPLTGGDSGQGGQGGQDGSDGSMGGLGGATPDPVDCGSSAPSQLIAGTRPPESLRCGGATGRTVRNGQTDPVDNEVVYAVGIVATDQVFNDGFLSTVYCAESQEVTTFFEQYKNSGGRGGGCGFSPAVRQLTWGLGSLTALLALAFVRRRRSAS